MGKDNKGFDLKFLNTSQDDGSTMELRDIEGNTVSDSKGKPVTITILSVDSKQYKRSIAEQQNRVLNNRHRKNNIDMVAMADIARNARAKITLGWSGIILNGKPLDCTYENVLMVYEKIAEVDEQVAEFVADRANFTITS